MNINHLHNDLLLSIFSHLKLSDLLSLELVCRRWRLLQEFTLCRVHQLVLIGPTSEATHNSTPLQLIQKSAHRYSVSISKSEHHVRLRTSKGLTFATCEFFLRKLPNISHLELVQVSLSRSVDLIVYLLNGWNLQTLKVLHDEKIHFATWGTATSKGTSSLQASSSRSQSKVLRKKYQQKNSIKFPSCLHTLLFYLTASWQPYLRHLTLVTFDCLSLKLPTSTFDLSQLTALHIIRPWETSTRLLSQILLSSNLASWTNLTQLTLYSDGNFSQLIRDYYDYLRPVFHNLTHLTLNFTSRTILSLIKQNCYQLTHLHLGCVTLPFIELALELEPLQFQLTHLELTFPYQSLPPSLEWSPLETPHKVPLFITVRSLHLHFSTLLHSPLLATPILGHLFPKLETLTLDRNKVENPTGGANCAKCARMRCITAFTCKHNLVMALRDAELNRMRSIQLQVETTQPTYVHDEANLSTLKTYEVYCYKKRLWTIESTNF